MPRKSNFLEKLGSLIPGYRGYSERDSRRNCDKHLREVIATIFTDIEKVLLKKINLAASSKDLILMRQLEMCRKEINTLQSKIKFAPYGASSFFSDSQIKEDELMKIYQFDLDMSEIATQAQEEIKQSGRVELILEKTEELSGVLNCRNNFIKKHK